MKYINDIYSDKAFHWLMFLKHNNLGFLQKKSLNTPPHKVEHDDTDDSISAYHDINDQIISIFGVEDSFEAHQMKKQDIAMLKLDFIINGNKMKRTEWKIKELDIQQSESNNDIKQDIEKDIEIISKSIGTGIIDIKEYSIYQYLIAKNSLKNGK